MANEEIICGDGCSRPAIRFGRVNWEMEIISADRYKLFNTRINM